jgi:chaperonin GroES
MARERGDMLGLKTRQVYPVDTPRASLGMFPDQKALARRFLKSDEPDVADGMAPEEPEGEAQEAAAFPDNLAFLYRLATKGGDISDLLDAAVVDRIGNAAVREWQIDQGSRQGWVDVAERGLLLATQERDEDDSEKEYPFANASDVNYPILTSAVTQFNARATPELIKGDKVVGVKTFSAPPMQPSPLQIAKEGPAPQSPQDAQQSAQAVHADQKAENMADLQAKARQARGQRVAHYLNFVIFYRMDDWEGETDLLLMESPVTGMGFKKVYMGPEGVRSDYASAMRLTVSNQTKSLKRCPRITQDYDIYPYEIEGGIRAGLYRDEHLAVVGEDPEASRKWIEQHRLEDLDGDGLPEPYIVTVDVETRRTMCIQAGFTLRDVAFDSITGVVTRIERWVPFPTFLFLPDPRGRFYGLGLAKLLEAITDSVDTSINQLIDAGNAEIAGGGFIGANVRLQGSGQGGAVYKQPGEYQTVSTSGPDLRQAIFEFTTPKPSAVTMQMLELLLAAAKDISSVKDVVTGDAPSTAPVGTTLALQNQALQVFSAIYKRMYRGFRDEFRLIYECLQRWATDRERKEYAELTGGNFDEDFSGDGTDIQPVADPSVVTKMQKMARVQTLIQLGESPVGIAAGMTQPGPAQEIMTEALNVLDVDRPERFLATVPPDPEAIAKSQDMAAAAALKQAQAKHLGSEMTALHSLSNERNAKTVRTMGEVAEQTHGFHQEAHRVAREGVLPAPEPIEGGDANGTVATSQRP